MSNAITLLNYNFKGGVGKTTLTGMQAYLLANKGEKILCVDIDPQSNLTEMLSKTYHKQISPARDFYSGFNKGNLKDSLVHVTNKIDVIPGDWNLNNLVNRLAQIHSSVRFTLLRKMLEPFKSNYDFILLDVPPTLNDIVLNAIFAADGISIVLQTQTMAYTSALKTVSELINIKKEYNPSFQFLGVVLYLFSKAKVDKTIIRKARETFKDALYSEPIKFQERVKGFTSTGIKDNDHWDRRAIGNYNRVNNAIIKRARKMINNG